MARAFQAYGLSYPLRAECPLELEDLQKLLTLAKLKKQSQETREALRDSKGVVAPDDLRKLAENLQRQETKATRLRVELKCILS